MTEPAVSGGAARAWPRLGLSTRILIGLGAGILVGLFFGPPAAALQPLADVYIRLMQMTVLPYLMVTLIVGLGQLDAAEARLLAIRGGVMLVVFWVLSLAIIAAFPLAFPAYQSGAFFSSSVAEPRQVSIFSEIFIPANPFHSLANNVVPAVVLFSIAAGAALIGVEGKERVLSGMRVLSIALVRITRFVIDLTPIGVFAIGAVAAGTMEPETLGHLEVYLVTFIAASLLLAFWVLPLAVTAVTPFRYGEVVSIARDALLTAFVANSAFIVLPILVERSGELMERHGLRSPEAVSAAEVIVPVAFNVPNAGRLLTLLFVPFTAWLAGSPLLAHDYPGLLGAGLFSYFAKAQVALPFLMDLMGVPQDLFQLYIPTTILNGKFDSLVSAMNLLAFALIGAGAISGYLVLRPARILRAVAAIVLGTIAVVVGTSLLLAAMVDTTDRKAELLMGMRAMHGQERVIVHEEPVPRDGVARPQGMTRFEWVRQRGTLRIGYLPDRLPFSFFNIRNELVGLDVDLAAILARDLGVVAEFVPIDLRALSKQLADGEIDVMPGVWYRTFFISSIRLSTPYLEGVMGFAMKDARREEFATIDALRQSRGLRIGVPIDPQLVEPSVRRYFNDAKVTLVPLDSPRPFFEGQHPELDAYLVMAEAGMAWTLLHPEYAVVVPQPGPVSVPVGFGFAMDAPDLAQYADEWLVIQRSQGAIQEAVDYWVYGRGAEKKVPRWSVIRNVLGWVE